jgi:hypothetical protein
MEGKGRTGQSRIAPGVHVEVLDVLAVGRGNVAAAGDGPDLGAEPRSSTVHRDGPDTIPAAGAELVVLMRAEASRAAEAQQKADVQQRPGRRSHRRTTSCYSCTRADRLALHSLVAITKATFL